MAIPARIRRNDYSLPADPIVTGRARLKNTFNCYREDGISGWMLHYTVEGEAWFETPEGQRFLATPESVVLVQAGTRHDYWTEPAGPGWDELWVVFKPPTSWQPWLDNWPSEGAGHFRLLLSAANSEVRKRVMAALLETHALSSSDAANSKTLAMNALEAALVWCDAANPRRAVAIVDSRVRRAVEFIRGALAKPIGLDAIAAASGLSTPHLCRLFRAEMKTTPIAFLERERIGRARQLLELSPSTVQAIAWEVGFENAFYFATRFKRHTGLSPRAYRANCRGGGEGEVAARREIP